jgi:hypothetical protein
VLEIYYHYGVAGLLAATENCDKDIKKRCLFLLLISRRPSMVGFVRANLNKQDAL